MHTLTRGSIVDFFRRDGNHQLSFVVTYGDNEYPKIGMRHQSYGLVNPNPLLGHRPYVAIVDPRLPPSQAVFQTIDQLEEGWPVNALVTVMSVIRALPADVDADGIKAALLAKLPDNSDVTISVWQKEPLNV